MVVVVGAALWGLRGEQPAALAPARPAPAPVEPGPVTSTEAPAPVAPVGEELTAAIDAFVGGVKVELPPAPATVLEDALREGKGPIDYKQALETTLRTRRGATLEAGRLLIEGMDDVDEAYLFQHTLVLAQHADPALSTVLLAGLDSAPARVRPHLVFALRGSNEPRVVERFVALYAEDDDPAVRAKAGFVLGERGERLDPNLVERARRTARADLHADDPELVESAADVLGIPPQDPSDRRELIETLRRDPSTPRRLAALRALAAGGAGIDELAPVLLELAQSPAADPALRDAAQRLLDAQPR